MLWKVWNMKSCHIISVLCWESTDIIWERTTHRTNNELRDLWERLCANQRDVFFIHHFSCHKSVSVCLWAITGFWWLWWVDYSLLWHLRSLSLVDWGRRGVCHDLIAVPVHSEHDDVLRNLTDRCSHNISPVSFNVIGVLMISVFSEPDWAVRLGVFLTLFLPVLLFYLRWMFVNILALLQFAGGAVMSSHKWLDVETGISFPSQLSLALPTHPTRCDAWMISNSKSV